MESDAATHESSDHAGAWRSRDQHALSFEVHLPVPPENEQRAIVEHIVESGFTLIVDVKGVGKTTALESLAVSLAAISRHINKLKGPVHGFLGSDIRAGTDALTVESEVVLDAKPFTYVIHQTRATAVAKAGKEGLPHEQTAEHRIEQRIRFETDGAIASSDPDFDAQLTAVLNLNLRLLKNRRKGVLTAILDWRKREKARRRRPLPKEQVVRERARSAGDGATQLTPFDPVAVWWHEQRLARSTT